MPHLLDAELLRLGLQGHAAVCTLPEHGHAAVAAQRLALRLPRQQLLPGARPPAWAACAHIPMLREFTCFQWHGMTSRQGKL